MNSGNRSGNNSEMFKFPWESGDFSDGNNSRIVVMEISKGVVVDADTGRKSFHS